MRKIKNKIIFWKSFQPSKTIKCVREARDSRMSEGGVKGFRTKEILQMKRIMRQIHDLLQHQHCKNEWGFFKREKQNTI